MNGSSIYNFIDTLDVSSKWKTTFKKIHTAYYSNYVHGKDVNVHFWVLSPFMRSLPLRDKLHFVCFDFLAFLLGPLFYIGTRMFTKGFILLLIYGLLFTIPATRILLIFPMLYCAYFAGLDYFIFKVLDSYDIISNPMLLNEYVDENFVKKVIKKPFNTKPLLAVIALGAIFSIINFVKTQLEISDLRNSMTTIPMVCTNASSCTRYVKDTLYRITGSANKEETYKNYYLIACAYTSINDKYSAVNALNMSLSLNKDYLSAYLLRAHIYMLNRSYAQAILDYKEVLDKSPKAVFLNYNIGRAFYQLGKYKEALQYFQRAKGSERQNPSFYEARAFTYVRLGENDLAIRDLEKAIKLYSKNATVQGQRRVIDLQKMMGKIRAGQAN